MKFTPDEGVDIEFVADEVPARRPKARTKAKAAPEAEAPAVLTTSGEEASENTPPTAEELWRSGALPPWRFNIVTNAAGKVVEVTKL